MNDDFRIDDFISSRNANRSRYERRITELQASGSYTESIERAVGGAIANIQEGNTRAFVIYGEPQSGKTEMMIALTARLLDGGHKIVIVLLNDSVQLLEQNLDRFLRSGLDPAPKKFNEILDPSIEIGQSPWVIFSKKNAADLQKLLNKLDGIDSKVVIDDEADFATPNAKVNKNERTRINELVGELLGESGIYIGVTATPARLDLNNTFENNNERWIDFPPHPKYTGQETFFPTTTKGFELGFGLRLLPDTGDDPVHLRKAFLSFLVNVAYLNTQVNDHARNYSILIHTSGKKVDHTEDFRQVVGILTILKDSTHKKFERYVRDIFDLARERYPQLEHDLTRYVVTHINQSDVVVMNSDTAKNAAEHRRATSPATLFTIAIGGNIVSRGVTFENLLCMFFTRDVKHKIQQDTYIQRARMFGSRGAYLKYFELYIPETLYFDWQKCFVFHRLSLSLIKAGKGSPIWLENQRIAAVAASSIDQAAVAFDSGEMSWDLFEYQPAIDNLIGEIGDDALAGLERLAAVVGDAAFPGYLLSFIREFSLDGTSIAVHKTTMLGPEYGSPEERKEVRRTKGFIASNALEKPRFPAAVHHVKIFKNAAGRARVFYKYTPETGGIRFLRNLARSRGR
jgi:hypothetical protein